MTNNAFKYKAEITHDNFQSINYFFIQKIVANLLPQRYSFHLGKISFMGLLACLFGVLLLFGMALNRLFGVSSISSQVWPIFLLGIVYIYILCLGVEFQVEFLLKFVREHLLSALTKQEDILSLQQSITSIFSKKSQFVFGLIFSLLVHATFVAFDIELVARFGVGFIIVNIVFHIFHGVCSYFFFSYLYWVTSKLKKYHLDLFELDPSSSAIVPKIVKLLQSTTLLMTFMVAIATIIFSSTRVLPFLVTASMVVLMWTSTISLYSANRHTLKELITRTKWAKMRKIQSQIRELEVQDKIPTKETLEHIMQLKEYHDKIMRSPDSPGGISHFFATLNTLVWPTLGILSSNLSGLLDFLEKISGFQLP